MEQSPLIQWFSFWLGAARDVIDFIISIDLGGMPLGSFILISVVMGIVFMILEGKGEKD